MEAISALNSAVRTGLDDYTAYCHQLRNMARQAALSASPAG